MANQSLFASLFQRKKAAPRADAVNEAGGRAYAFTAKQALAQYAATGALHDGFYADAQSQMTQVLGQARAVGPEFLAKTAVYAFERGHMKDMPALLLAELSQIEAQQGGDLLLRAFPRVVRNGKMLRNFVQIMRSGATGRKSLGSRPKRLARGWIDAASPVEILRAAVGNDPSLADVVKMVHPKPQTPERAALYAWLIGRPYDVAALPEVVRDFEAFKRDMTRPVPEVPFQMLTALPLEKVHWRQIMEKAGWQMLRQNLNSFGRIGMFQDQRFTERLAARLADPEEIRKARLMPYQLMTTLNAVSSEAPKSIRKALETALEASLSNTPRIKGRVVVCPDVSGSMSSPVTGYRKGATTVTRCVDVAALIAAAFARMNKEASILPFDHQVHRVDLKGKTGIFDVAKTLAAYGGGGTDMAAPLRDLVESKAKLDLLVFVSDNESWIDRGPQSAGTPTMALWRELAKANPGAKMVCVDLQPYGTTQAKSASDVLNVGGFSDQVFDVIASFVSANDPDHWVSRIEEIVL